MKAWQLQDAKARLSELVRFVQKEPIAITVHGRKEAIVISIKDFEKLKPKQTLGEFFDASPLKGIDLDIERDRSLSRDIDFGDDE